MLDCLQYSNYFINAELSLSLIYIVYVWVVASELFFVQRLGKKIND